MMVYEYMPGCPQTIEDNRQIGLGPPLYVVASSGARFVCVLTSARARGRVVSVVPSSAGMRLCRGALCLKTTSARCARRGRATG